MHELLNLITIQQGPGEVMLACKVRVSAQLGANAHRATPAAEAPARRP